MKQASALGCTFWVQFTLIVLKLLGVLDLPWLIVLLPIIGIPVLAVLMILWETLRPGLREHNE